MKLCEPLSKDATEGAMDLVIVGLLMPALWPEDVEVMESCFSRTGTVLSVLSHIYI